MERSISSLAYKGFIPEAIIESKRQKKLFVVYISGSDGESTQLESVTWTDTKVAETVSKYCILLHVQGGSPDAVNFSAIYPQKSIPSITAIGFNGVQVWQSEGFVDAEYLASSLEKAWLSLHIQETTATVLTAALSTQPPVSGSLERGGSSNVVPSSSTDVDRTSLQARQTASENMKVNTDHAQRAEVTETELVNETKTIDDLAPSVGGENSTCVEDGVSSQHDPNHQLGVSGSELKSITDDVSEAVQDENENCVDVQRGDNLENAKRVDAPSHVTLNIRLPDGVNLQEKFSVSYTLGMVKDYVDSQASIGGAYDLAIPYPRKVFVDQELSKSLTELGLLNRQALIVVPHQRARRNDRGSTSSVQSISQNISSSNANGGGYFDCLKRIISYINPLSYLGGSPSSSTSVQGESGTWEYGPNPALRNNIGGTSRLSSIHSSGQNTSAGSSNDGRQSNQTTSRFGSNVHTLKHDEDDSRFNDKNSFWNGNSTQYGGDSDRR